MKQPIHAPNIPPSVIRPSRRNGRRSAMNSHRDMDSMNEIINITHAHTPTLKMDKLGYLAGHPHHSSNISFTAQDKVLMYNMK